MTHIANYLTLKLNNQISHFFLSFLSRYCSIFLLVVRVRTCCLIDTFHSFLGIRNNCSICRLVKEPPNRKVKEKSEKTKEEHITGFKRPGNKFQALYLFLDLASQRDRRKGMWRKINPKFTSGKDKEEAQLYIFLNEIDRPVRALPEKILYNDQSIKLQSGEMAKEWIIARAR